MKLAKLWIGALPLLFSSSSLAAVTYTYDNLNRLANVDYGDGTSQVYTYDAAGNMLTMTTAGAKASQTVSFGAAPTIAVGGTGTVSATATSGLAVSLTPTTPNVCTVSGSTVTGIAAGTCIIAANQAGNASYNAAIQVTQSINIGNKASQTISFDSIPSIVAIGATGTVSATATSGLPVTYSSTTSVCSVSGSTVTGIAAGTCIIAADQAGNANYNAASQVTQSITIGSGDINVTGVVRLRPQVLMAGFDPILIDLADTSFKLFCVVRPGAVAIQDVRTANNGGGFSVAMNHAGTYSGGDQRYEMNLTFPRGTFPDNSVLGDLFGSATSQFRMSVTDSAQMTHSFPHIEFGNNVPMTTPVTSPNVPVSTTAGTRRSLPQVLAAGFDPMLIDLSDTSFDVVAIVRAGIVPVGNVSLSQNQGGFAQAMNLTETLPNGDMKYKATFTYPRGSFPETSMADLFGTQSGQFNFVVTDQSQQTHRFPELRVGNHPAM